MMLEGNKTYLMAGAGAVVIFLHLIGVIEADTTKTLLALFGFGAAAGLRDAISKK